MAKYKAYPEYKDSGVEWLGEIPSDWQTLCGKYVFKEIKELSTSGDEMLLSVSEYYGVKPRQEVIEDGDFISRADSLIGYKKCQVNDLAMNIMLAWKCGLGVSKYEGIISPAYSVFRFDTAIALPGYMHYLLRTKIYTDHFKSLSTGVIDSRLRLYPEMFGGVEILLPELDEQVNIYAFLDHETAKIDNLIEKQQQLIELLKEKRQAVISHAVTKGLNPDVSMKDSGVEWLGEVPEHWVSVRVKQISSFITSGPRGWSDFITDEGNEIFLQSGDLNNELGLQLDKAKRVSPPKNAEGVRTKLVAGDVVVCITGANTGRVAIVPELSQSTYINQHLSLIRPNTSTINSAFLGYSLASSVGRSFFDVAQYGLKEGLSLGNVSEAPLALPPKHEQDVIVKYLESIRNNYDNLSRLSTIQIELLKERRTALISAAVTGKIDVRDWVAPDTQDIEESQEVNA
ncbi:restriction endonuclease subunit S [Pectobacterium carotovorum]|nr:restriction endonuclease subunit S [Pectobacterium carotovorum]